jgi:NAD(P)-dependent dehydrogenase (short-subunit alcohol dehydrogenase family)
MRGIPGGRRWFRLRPPYRRSYAWENAAGRQNGWMVNEALLDDEVALITGGASGLGLAVARRFLAEGARVAVLDKSAERLAAVNDEFGGAVLAVEGDVTTYADNARAVAETVSRFGKLSIFVGNAGIYDKRVALDELRGDQIEKAFDEIFGINVKGYALGARAACEELTRNRGAIVFTHSISGLYAGYGGFLYVAAKHALTGLTRNLAIELAPAVRVNAVAPGYVPTNLSGLETLGQGASKTGPPPGTDRFLLEYVPTADDYTMLYVMLAARTTGRVMSGTIVLADGGSSIHRA